jgi:hypothetical protein
MNYCATSTSISYAEERYKVLQKHCLHLQVSFVVCMMSLSLCVDIC